MVKNTGVVSQKKKEKKKPEWLLSTKMSEKFLCIVK